MTLSHRWGVESYKILKSTTLKNLQISIDIFSLPQIFQDTIQIAVHLGIHYLWIDSLCVLQDDWSDWEHEAKNLEKIYSSAFLNVSATMSIDGSESLVSGHPSVSYHPPQIELELNQRLQMFLVVDGDMWVDQIENAPLNKRGWVFPERFLACRVLHFGQSQMGWECREQATLQAFPNGLPQTCPMQQMAKPQFESMINALTRNPVQDYDHGFSEKWQQLVHQYSKCAFTDPEDKLIAFSSIASRIMQDRDDYYIAGMWKSSMAYDLGWWRPTEVREAFPVSKTSSRAPSWSWASVDGEIIFPSTIGGVRAHFVEIEEILKQVTVENNVPTTRSSIRIKGQLLPLRAERSDERIVSFAVAHIRFFVGDSSQGSFIGLESPKEEVQDLLQRGRLLFLPLFATSYLISGIALTKIHGVCAYRRLGALEIPVMRDSVSIISTAESEHGGQNQQCDGLQREGWVEIHQSMPQSNARSRLWSVAAAKLLHFLNLRQTSRIIELF